MCISNEILPRHNSASTLVELIFIRLISQSTMRILLIAVCGFKVANNIPLGQTSCDPIIL